MKNSLPDRSLVRQYLLGRLDDKEELEDDLSEGILLNDELAEIVDSIEEEIIEEYLDGALDSADKQAVDEYFLRPPERKEKLRFARLLRHYFEKQQDDLVEPRLDVAPVTRPNAIQGQTDLSSAGHWHPYFRTYGQFAALILVSVLSLIYISGIRKSQARLEGELMQERGRSASLLDEARLLESPMVPLTLVSDRSDLSRTTGTQGPHIEIKPSNQRIIVEIALQSGVSGSYDVRLETKEGKGPIWSARLLPLVSASGDAQLVFLLPVQGIKSDDYSFAVSSALPGSGEPKHYDFQIRLTDR
jgi:hypothetical protein